MGALAFTPLYRLLPLVPTQKSYPRCDILESMVCFVMIYLWLIALACTTLYVIYIFACTFCRGRGELAFQCFWGTSWVRSEGELGACLAALGAARLRLGGILVSSFLLCTFR